FQAEDGIRDPLVTGVQTCALPISHDSDRERHQKKEKNDSAFPALLAQRTRSSGCIERMCGFECHRDLKPLVRLVTSCTLFLSARSEERRVGKESMSRWLPILVSWW